MTDLDTTEDVAKQAVRLGIFRSTSAAMQYLVPGVKMDYLESSRCLMGLWDIGEAGPRPDDSDWVLGADKRWYLPPADRDPLNEEEEDFVLECDDRRPLHTLTEEQTQEEQNYLQRFSLEERYSYYRETENLNSHALVEYLAARFAPRPGAGTTSTVPSSDDTPPPGGAAATVESNPLGEAAPETEFVSDLPAHTPDILRGVTDQLADAEALAQVMHMPTEDNVALLFEQQLGNLFRYCKQWGQWLMWDGARWRPERTDAALDFCRKLARKVNHEGKTSISKASFARGVESLVRAARCFATVPEQWDQDEFSLNTPAGIVNLRTGELVPHSGQEYVTRVTRVSPQPGPRPVFDQFMRQITLDDQELIAYHQRSIGATLSGARADHWLLFWLGQGRNGKNTLGDLVEWILGDYAKTIPTETLMRTQNVQHPTELANLRALRLATSSEIPEGAHLNESRIKSLTGDAMISARYMRGDFFEFPRSHKHLVYGNHRPMLRVVDDAIKARLHFVPFKATFSDELGNCDPLLPEKLRAEAPAILAWLIEGHLQWKSDGYTLRRPDAVQRETDDYFAAQSTPDMWITECCELIPGDDRPTGALDTASALYADFAKWKEARGEHATGQARWGEWMGNRFEKVKASTMRYRGIRLKREQAYRGDR